MQLPRNAKQGLPVAVLCVFIVASATAQKVSFPRSAQGSSQEKDRLQQLRDTASEIQKIILRQDIPALLKYVESLRDDQVFQEVQRDLRDRNSLLYGRLFDSRVLDHYKNGSPPAISVRDYFLRAKDVRIDVSFQGQGEGKLQWGYVIYYSSHFRRRNWPKASFFYSDGKWWLRDLFQGDE